MVLFYQNFELRRVIKQIYKVIHPPNKDKEGLFGG